MTTETTQPTAAAPKKPAQMAETTYFVLVNDEYESKAGRAYLKTIYPQSLARVVTELRLDRLTDKHTVIPILRGDDRSPAVPLVRDAHGIRVPQPAPVTELMKEVREGQPVACAKYWQPGTGNEGELNVAGFLEEVGKSCVPAAVKYYPRENIMKLGFA